MPRRWLMMNTWSRLTHDLLRLRENGIPFVRCNTALGGSGMDYFSSRQTLHDWQLFQYPGELGKSVLILIRERDATAAKLVMPYNSLLADVSRKEIVSNPYVVGTLQGE